MQSALRSTTDGLEQNAFVANPALRPRLGTTLAQRNAAYAALTALLEQDMRRPGAFINDAGATFAAGQAAMATNAQLSAAAAAELDALLVQRIAGPEYRQKKIAVLAFTLVLVLSAVYLFVALYRAIMATIRHLDQAAHSLISADGGGAVLLDTRDELGQVAAAFNQLIGELVTTRDQALEASRTKSAFLANMSHELRTPLNAIIGYSEMLQETAQDLEQPEFLPDLRKIRGAGKHLLSLINDILDLSKIEAGKMDVYLEDISIAALIQEIATTIQPLVSKNGNRLVLDYPPTIGTMQTDVTKVRQTLFNLLSNAAKFTEGGTVTLQAARTTADDGEWITFAVSDTGIGLSDVQLGKLFQQFSQAELLNHPQVRRHRPGPGPEPALVGDARRHGYGHQRGRRRLDVYGTAAGPQRRAGGGRAAPDHRAAGAGDRRRPRDPRGARAHARPRGPAG